jgi:hypothetical protein
LVLDAKGGEHLSIMCWTLWIWNKGF